MNTFRIHICPDLSAVIVLTSNSSLLPRSNMEHARSAARRAVFALPRILCALLLSESLKF